MQYLGHAFKIYWMYGKIFLVSLCRDKRCEWLPRKENFCLKNIAAWLPRLKSAVLDLGCMNSLGIRKSDIKGPLDCLQAHSYTNLIYPNRKSNNVIFGFC